MDQIKFLDLIEEVLFHPASFKNEGKHHTLSFLRILYLYFHRFESQNQQRLKLFDLICCFIQLLFQLILLDHLKLSFLFFQGLTGAFQSEKSIVCLLQSYLTQKFQYLRPLFRSGSL